MVRVIDMSDPRYVNPAGRAKLISPDTKGRRAGCSRQHARRSICRFAGTTVHYSRGSCDQDIFDSSLNHWLSGWFPVLTFRFDKEGRETSPANAKARQRLGNRERSLLRGLPRMECGGEVWGKGGVDGWVDRWLEARSMFPAGVHDSTDVACLHFAPIHRLT